MYSVYSFMFYKHVKINIGRSVPEQHIVFDRFNGSLFTANHLHNLASSLFNMHSSSNLLSPAQNTFVSSAKSINFTKYVTRELHFRAEMSPK